MRLEARAFLCALSFLMPLSAFSFPLEAVLTLKETVPMTDLANKVLDPKSDRYGIYYSPEEIRSLVGPSDADYAQLLNSLAEQGFSVVKESKTHLTITIRADHQRFESTFKTKIQWNGAHTFTNQGLPEIPQALELVENITGLDNSHAFKPRYKIAPKTYGANGQPGILPAQIKTAYGLDPLYQEGLTGKGQDIAIAGFMDFSLQNVRAYYEKIGLNPIPEVDQIIFDGKPGHDIEAAVETELDAELLAMIAPGAKIHVFSSSINSDAGELTVFTAILDDNRSKLVSYSWGECEPMVTKSHKKDMDRVFARAVAQGINILVASGDEGSDSCNLGGLSAGWPNINPYVVSVGGTSLYLSDKGVSEVGWLGSGGGVSKLYTLPCWQFFKIPHLMRADPDIAFNSDPKTGEAIWTQEKDNQSPAWLVVGGTSMAAPQWVGFLALVNEARKEKDLEPLGYINPIFYKAKASQRKDLFRDITTGNNGAYTARKGWDEVTGWGSMNGEAMLNYLLMH